MESPPARSNDCTNIHHTHDNAGEPFLNAPSAYEKKDKTWMKEIRGTLYSKSFVISRNKCSFLDDVWLQFFSEQASPGKRSFLQFSLEFPGLDRP